MNHSDTPAPSISAAELSRLAGRIDGPVLRPGEPGYEAETHTWNLTLRHRPAVAVGATSARDVQAAVAFAADHALPVAVVATGHGAVVPADGALLVTTWRMDDVRVDPAAGVAHIAAGARWQQVVDAAAKVGLAPPAGSSPDVGAVGYTLGGGLSPALGRKYGYAADLVRSIDVVTPDGVLRHVDAGHESELFWALRGGKGNFGVVTSIELGLVAVQRFYGGGLFFGGEHARAVLEAFRAATRTAPDELTLSVALLRVPPEPSVPEPLRGRFVVHARVAYLGAPADGERLIAGLRAVAPPLLDTVTELPFTAIAAVHLDPADPMPVVERTAQLAGLPDEAVDALLAVAGPGADVPVTMVEVRHLGGALDRQPAVPNAVSGRGAPYNLFVASIAPPELHATAHAAQAEIVDAVAPWLTGRALLNFLSAGDADPDLVREAFDAAAYDRLARIKAIHDPENLFRVNHNIPPRL